MPQKEREFIPIPGPDFPSPLYPRTLPGAPSSCHHERSLLWVRRRAFIRSSSLRRSQGLPRCLGRDEEQHAAIVLARRPGVPSSRHLWRAIKAVAFKGIQFRPEIAAQAELKVGGDALHTDVHVSVADSA